MSQNHNQHNKPKVAQPIYDDMDENDIDVTLKKELADAGLEYRFVDFKQARMNGGRSRAGWRVYKRVSEDPRIQGISGMSDPDGLVRQGTLVLAVKTIASAQKQRQRRDDQNTTLKKYNEHVTKELEGDARKLGGSRAISGYEKNS